MIEVYYIVALAMAITNIYKNKVKAPAVPILAFITVIVLNILNAFVFDGVIKDAIREAFIVGGITIGLFNAGDATRKILNHEKPMTR